VRAETIHALVVARTLFDQVNQTSSSEDEHNASAALVTLQDAVELVLLASLAELGIDEQKNIESFSFDQLIGELRGAGITVPKSGTLKAMNKERVIVKHYGQLAEPKSVRNYIYAAKLAVDSVLKQIVGKDLQSIMLHELLPEGEVKEFFRDAAKEIERGEFFAALVSIRKALFVEVEVDYVIEEWKDDVDLNPFAFLGRKGSKASFYTRNKDWIDNHVRELFDYIQMDHEKMRLDLLEWGVNTQDYWNVWRITPEVYRSIGGGEWVVKLTADRDGANIHEAEYCLDRAIYLVSKKIGHFNSAKFYARREQPFMEVIADNDIQVYASSSIASAVVGTISSGKMTYAESLISGLDGRQYFRIFDYGGDSKTYISGYSLATYFTLKGTAVSEPGEQGSLFGPE
jgi:hypothetical protein